MLASKWPDVMGFAVIPTRLNFKTDVADLAATPI
jgi:hypothetical protein